MVDILLGLQWGDEGKGKVVDFLCPAYQMVARFQGGPNAGHSLKINGQSFVLNTIPSGIFREHCKNLIGSGVVIDPAKLQIEIEKVKAAGAPVEKNLLIARKAHLILPTHIMLDAAQENAKGTAKIGSTLRGISPTYQDKIGRAGLRMGDLHEKDFDKKYQLLAAKHIQMIEALGGNIEKTETEKAFMEAVEYLRAFQMVDSEYYVNDFIFRGHRILAEGAQGTMLDIDYGTYPYVTSSNTISAGACTGLGISPQKIKHVYGVFKAYCTRVGSGPFPSELDNQAGEDLRQKGGEFGATTGRPRRTGWLDLPALNYAIMLNGADKLIMTKADVLCGLPEVDICTAYKTANGLTDKLPYDLCTEDMQMHLEKFAGWDDSLHQAETYNAAPQTFKDYIKFIEQSCGMGLTAISTGPEREKTFFME